MALVIVTSHVLRFSMLGVNVKQGCRLYLRFQILASCMLQCSVLNVTLDLVLFKVRGSSIISVQSQRDWYFFYHMLLCVFASKMPADSLQCKHYCYNCYVE